MAVLLGAGACDEYVGCAPVLTTDGGQLELHDQAITVGACQRLREPAPLLEGSLWCPAVQCGGEVDGCENEDGDKLPDATVAACFEQALSGPVLDEAPCLRMTAPGDAAWSFTAVECAAQGLGYNPVDDRIGWTVVAVDEIAAHLQAPGDAFALRSLLDGEGDALPSEDALAPGDVAYALAGDPVPFAIVLRHPEHEAAVGWNPTNWTVAVESIRGAPPAVTLDGLGLVNVTIDADAEASIAIVPGPDALVSRTLAVGTVVGVAAEALVSIEIAEAYAPPEDDSGLRHGPVAGARAILRDAQGHAVYGAPVEWSVLEGALPVWREAMPGWSPDYIALAERDGASCHAPPEGPHTYDAVVAASFGNLFAEASVEWTETVPREGFFAKIGDAFRDPPPRSPNCEGPGFPDEQGCSCQTHESTPAAAWMLSWVALAFLRRKKRR